MHPTPSGCVHSSALGELATDTLDIRAGLFLWRGISADNTAHKVYSRDAPDGYNRVSYILWAPVVPPDAGVLPVLLLFAHVLLVACDFGGRPSGPVEP